MQAQCIARLPLAERYRLNTRADNLSDISGRIDNQPEKQGEKFGADRAAALEAGFTNMESWSGDKLAAPINSPSSRHNIAMRGSA